MKGEGEIDRERVSTNMRNFKRSNLCVFEKWSHLRIYAYIYIYIYAHKTVLTDLQ